MKLRMVPLAILAAACGSPASPPAAPTKPVSIVADTVDQGGAPIKASVTDREALQATANLLAGLTDGNDPLTGAGALHAEQMEGIWAQVEERHLTSMRAWANDQLLLAAPAAPLYYPFSGPDLPSALQFFPTASSYVLVGLESPGKIPDLEGLTGEPLETELERLRGGLKNLAEAGYFVTKRMETDFVASRLDGVLPVLYSFLARAGFTPIAVEFIRLDRDGAVVPLETATDRSATAVRVRFEASAQEGAETDRSLYYFSRDLSNTAFTSSPSFAAFLRGLGAFSVYMKSASYLSHMDDFTAHTDFLVAHAGAVLQDDSGIPLSALPSSDWRLRFFGTYTRTLPTYREWFQEDLKAVYGQSGISPLPFAIGYHSKIGGSCLIWAERRGD